MKLTDEEKRMGEGNQGTVVMKFMKLLISIGEAFDAPRMLPTISVHVTSVSLATLMKGGKHIVEEITDSGSRLKAFTTINPLATDFTQWDELGIPEEEASEQLKIEDSLREIGAILCNTCTPYLVGHVPMFGQNIAWGEASAVIYANSVLGARTNPEGGPSGLASALTGRTPEYGLHLDLNRLGEFVVRVQTELKEPTEYGALAFFTGAAQKKLIPVLAGIPAMATCDDLKMFSASLHGQSSAKIFHAIGLTPEAKTEEQALGGRKPVDVINFGNKELEATLQTMTSYTKQDVSWVVVGCPHCSITEIREVVRVLNGRKVHSNVALWICTSRPVKTLADHMGFTEAIEKCGGRIVCDTCPILSTKRTLENLGFRSITTNSTVMAVTLPSILGINAHCGRLYQCIDAAVSGIWR